MVGVSAGWCVCGVGLFGRSRGSQGRLLPGHNRRGPERWGKPHRELCAGAPVKGTLLSYFGWLSVLVSFPEIFGKSEACLPDNDVDENCYLGQGHKEQCEDYAGSCPLHWAKHLEHCFIFGLFALLANSSASSKVSNGGLHFAGIFLCTKM